MSERDLEVLITLDDPGEDDLEEDTFPGDPTRQTEVIEFPKPPGYLGGAIR